MSWYARLLFGLTALLAGCSGGAVVLVTPQPPDLSPVLYMHPSGAFTVTLPRHWSASAQNTTTVAAAAFAPPDAHEPILRFAVLNLGTPVDSAALREFIDQYQTEFRPNAASYAEVNRQAMGDGSWRLTGVQHSPGGVPQPVNTFIEASGSLVGVIEIVLPDSPAALSDLQRIVNTFALAADTPLTPAKASALALVAAQPLDAVSLFSWRTPAGALVISGEIMNRGAAWSPPAPVRAVLRSTDGAPVAEAAAVVLGHGIPPGGFAPFVVRFDGGQPALAAGYDLIIGRGDSAAAPAVIGQESLNWTDESSVNDAGELIITGTVSNTGPAPVRELRAVVTLFNPAQQVVAAGQGSISPALAPGESTAFQITLPEVGGEAANYILNIQGLP